MMGDGKALQSGTSHFLGQNFAKPSKSNTWTRTANCALLDDVVGLSTRVIGP